MGCSKTTIKILGLVSLVAIVLVTHVSSLKNIYFPEKMLLKFEKNVYVRVYQAIFGEQEKRGKEISEDRYPDTNSKDKVEKESAKYKDIFQDTQGNVIIYPNGGKIKGDFYIGIGDFRNQLKFMYRYVQGGAENPVIKSFIMPYKIVWEIISNNTGTDVLENEVKDSSSACDTEYSNQFGFIRCHTDLFRAYALPKSLVTIVEKKIEGNHLGLVKVMNIIPKDEHDKSTEMHELWKRKGIDDHSRADPDVLKSIGELDIAKIPEIHQIEEMKLDMETGITEEMLKQSEEYQKAFGDVSRFLNILEAFGVELFSETYEKEAKINKIRSYKSVENTLKMAFNLKDKEEAEQMKRQMEGGFLIGLPYKFGDIKKTNELLTEIVENMVDKAELELDGKLIALKIIQDMIKRREEKEEMAAKKKEEREKEEKEKLEKEMMEKGKEKPKEQPDDEDDDKGGCFGCSCRIF